MTSEAIWPESMPRLRDFWTLDSKIHYLNHGAFGATPRAVLEHQSELRARMEREPAQFFLRYVGPELERARAALGAFINADADDLALVANATSGVNLVLRNIELEPDDEILTTNHDYPSCRMALKALADRYEARLEVVDLPLPIAGPEAIIDAIVGAVSSRTRLVMVDHVTSPTGMVMPVEQLVRRLESRGVDVLVDGAHATGMLELDVSAIGAAYYVGNLHKWLCTPKGTAYVHVRRDRQKGFEPLVISRGFPSGNDFRRQHDWPGTFDCTGLMCIPKAIEVMGTMLPGGWAELRIRNRAMARAARAHFATTLAIEPPVPESMLGALVTLPLPPHRELVGPASTTRLDPLAAELFDQHGVEVPVFAWPAWPRRWFRISAQLYNDQADYEALARAMASTNPQSRS